MNEIAMRLMRKERTLELKNKVAEEGRRKINRWVKYNNQIAKKM